MASLNGAYRDQVRRIIGEHYRLPRPTPERALAHQRRMTRNEQRGWWMSIRPRMKHHLLALPRRLPQPEMVARAIARRDRQQTERLGAMLYGLKGAPGFLSGDPIFAQRVDQLSGAFDKLLRST